MKTTLTVIVSLGVGIAVAMVFLNRQQSVPPAPLPLDETTAARTTEPPEVAVSSEAPPPAAVILPEPVSVPTANFSASEPESEAAAAFRKTIDALLSPQTALHQKHLLFDQLRTSGQLDQVITELKRRAAEDPTNPAIPTTLGEAMLNKVRQLHEAGADVNEVGILAMQADQSFNAALKMDPANWEAQFVKYSTMFYWPPEPTRDNEAAQKLSNLIDQQEAQPLQPQYVQTYVALGNQYQKMGKPDFAEATWRLGLTKFPNDPTLLKKLTP